MFPKLMRVFIGLDEKELLALCCVSTPASSVIIPFISKVTLGVFVSIAKRLRTLPGVGNAEMLRFTSISIF